MDDSEREVEIALAICSERPAEVAREVAGLGRLGAYRLLPLDRLRIRDTYFDTKDGRLSRQRLALRVREVDGRPHLTLKGDSDPASGAEHGRMEIEAPWSQSTLARILAALRRRGLAVPPATAGLADASPIDVLEQLGFIPRQDRETLRERRHVIPTDGTAAPLCELAIDAVTFRLDGRRARIHQVEIEALAPSARAEQSLTEIRDDLLGRFARTLRPWPHGKLATGLALAELLAQGRLEPFLDPVGEVGPAGCDAIEDLFASGAV